MAYFSDMSGPESTPKEPLFGDCWLDFYRPFLPPSQQFKSNQLSLRFNGHFPGEPGLAGVN